MIHKSVEIILKKTERSKNEVHVDDEDEQDEYETIMT